MNLLVQDHRKDGAGIVSPMLAISRLCSVQNTWLYLCICSVSAQIPPPFQSHLKVLALKAALLFPVSICTPKQLRKKGNRCESMEVCREPCPSPVQSILGPAGCSSRPPLSTHLTTPLYPPGHPLYLPGHPSPPT